MKHIVLVLFANTDYRIEARYSRTLSVTCCFSGLRRVCCQHIIEGREHVFFQIFFYGFLCGWDVGLALGKALEDLVVDVSCGWMQVPFRQEPMPRNSKADSCEQ